MAQAEGEMTLVIDFAALRRLSDPAAAVEDARRWSAGVGVVGEDYEALTAFLDREGVEPNFVAGQRGLVGGLTAIRQRVDADRHVFVGTTAEARANASAVGWEYIDIEEAAEKAEWGFTDSDEET